MAASLSTIPIPETESQLRFAGQALESCRSRASDLGHPRQETKLEGFGFAMWEWIAKFGVAGFLFFFIKGMLWLIIPATVVMVKTRMGKARASAPTEPGASTGQEELVNVRIKRDASSQGVHAEVA